MLKESEQKKESERKYDIELRNRIHFEPGVCVKCGYCKSNCPTYLVERDERVSPRGRLILSKKLYSENLEIRDVINIYNDLDTCSKCTECERTCPVGLKPWLNFVLVKNQTIPGKFESLLSRIISKSRSLFTLVVLTTANLRGCNAIRRPNGRKYNVPLESPKPTNLVHGDSERIFFFPTCFGYTIFKDIVEKGLIILRYLNVDCEVLPSRFACCGAPIFFSGDIKGFREHAKNFYKKFEKVVREADNKKSPKFLVFGNTCAWIMKQIFPAEAGLTFPEVQEVSDFIVELLSTEQDLIKSISKKAKKIGRFLVHKPCHAEKDLGSFIRLLGLDFDTTDFPCCGFGGTLMFKHQKMPLLMLSKTLDDKDVDFVVTTSPGCLLQSSRRKRTYHFIEFLFDILNSHHPQ